MEDTQVVPDTQEAQMRSPSPLAIHKNLSLPPSDICASMASPSTQGIDTQLLEEKLRKIMRNESALSDTEMLGELLLRWCRERLIHFKDRYGNPDAFLPRTSRRTRSEGSI